MPELVSFLLRSIGADLRSRLEEDAVEQEIPLIEVIRTILCSHYELECPPVGAQRRDLWTDTDTILLKLPKLLFSEVVTSSENTGRSMRQVIMDVLEAHYTEVHPR